MQNAPTPGLMYPKNGAIWSFSEMQRLGMYVYDLINACVEKDIQNAQLNVENGQLKARIAELEGKNAGLPEGVVALPLTPMPAAD